MPKNKKDIYNSELIGPNSNRKHLNNQVNGETKADQTDLIIKTLKKRGG